MSKNKDLLREAIADAQQVKKTAIANAKLALEEAFTPQLQSMISAKLSEESEDDEELEDDSEINPDVDADADTEDDSEMDIDMDADVDGEEDDLDVSDIDDEESEDDEDDLDLESVIAELGIDDEESDDEELDPDVDADTEDDEDADTEDDEELDLDEVIRSIREMEDDEYIGSDANDDVVEMKSELKEAYSTIKQLRGTLTEVNILNAKLLYTNKLFRTFDLSEGQKVKVLENFDRTNNVREVKLVFSTLAESLTGAAQRRKKLAKTGFASTTVKSPKRMNENVIPEGSELQNRFKKLAGLIK